MRLFNCDTLPDYLRERELIGPDERVQIRELTGGVSNMVLLVEWPGGERPALVIKQARSQLRTTLPWFSRVERIWREADVLRWCNRLLAADARDGAGTTTTRILFEDREEYLFGMTAVPEPHRVWKRELLERCIKPWIAEAAGRLLGRLHARSWRHAEIARQLADRSLFEELRVEPYYQTLAERRADARAGVERLIASLASHELSLVHADFSPKNLLVHDSGLTLVDFETGHLGDPAFDLGFFLSHLVLKACYASPQHAPYLVLVEAFRLAYDAELMQRVTADEHAALWQRGIQHLAGCAWARLDGKSPVEYLTDEGKRELVRMLCRNLFVRQPVDLHEALCVVRASLEK